MNFKKLQSYQVNNPCLKQNVKALIVTQSGEEAFGSNHINNQVSSCPRVEQNCKTGEGYHLCKQVCAQGAHAEVDAIENAQKQGLNIEGATLYLMNHYYCCEPCLNAMKSAKISSAVVFADDGSIKAKYDLN